MLLWEQSESMEKQNLKLAKSYTEVKNQMRLEKKMGRVYEFLMTKGGNLKENELELLEAMKQSLSPGKEGHMDDKYNALIKQKDQNSMEVENLKRVIDEIKR